MTEKLRIKMVKICGAKKSGILKHSMLVATMMMVAQMMRGMECNCHHGEKLGISGMEFQFNVGEWVWELKERLFKHLQIKKEQAIQGTLPDESKYLNNLLKPISY